MKVCDLNTGLGRLTQAYAQLKERWADTKSHWNDERGRQFEEQHLREIPNRMQQMVGAIGRLTEVLEKAQRECEDNVETF